MPNRARRALPAASTVALLSLAAVPGAPAKITGYPVNPSATPVAKAMQRESGLVKRGVFSALPPSSKPAAVSTTRLAGFPTAGKSFGILSTGNARNAAKPNTAPDTGSESGGPAIRGARDVVIMRVDMNVPKGHNCLSFDFRFLSEEFPEFVNEKFNDAFIAELGHSTWDAGTKTDPRITAPNNFAKDIKGNPIRINSVGDATAKASYAKGTTFDGATRKLRASSPIKSGFPRLYLSIFDQGDRVFDSAAFFDNLRTSRANSCKTGVRAAS